MNFLNFDENKDAITSLAVDIWRKVDPTVPIFADMGEPQRAFWRDVVDSVAFAIKNGRDIESFLGREAAGSVALLLFHAPPAPIV